MTLRRSLGSLVTLLCAVLLVGCGAPSTEDGTASAGRDPGRAGFEPIAVPAAGSTGSDPIAIAQALYGATEPVEGNYTEEAETLATSSDQQVVLFTLLGLPDDSVRGQRYRLEFASQGQGWELTWVGTQVQCWPGRGHEDWSTEPCI